MCDVLGSDYQQRKARISSSTNKTSPGLTCQTEQLHRFVVRDQNMEQRSAMIMKRRPGETEVDIGGDSSRQFLSRSDGATSGNLSGPEFRAPHGMTSSQYHNTYDDDDDKNKKAAATGGFFKKLVNKASAAGGDTTSNTSPERRFLWFLVVFVITVMAAFMLGRTVGSRMEGSKRSEMKALKNKWLLQYEHEKLNQEMKKPQQNLEECQQQLRDARATAQRLENTRAQNEQLIREREEQQSAQ